MTDENLAAGAMMSAGIDLKVPMPTMSDINATVGELLQHVDDGRDATEHSTWLQNAISAIDSARQYIENHLSAFETKVKDEVAEIETKVEGAIETVKNEGTEVAASIAAAAAASIG